MVWDIAILEQKTKIPANKLQAIKALDGVLTHSQSDLSAESVHSIQEMLANCIGNMESNKAISALALYPRWDSGLSHGTETLIKDMSYRTRNIHKILPQLDKIYEHFEQATLGTKQLGDDEKITLEQYGILHDLATMNKQLIILDTLGLIKGNSNLEMLYHHTQHAELMIKHFDNTFDTTFQVPTGTVVLANAANKAKIHGITFGLLDKLAMFCILKFSHASIAISVENKSVSENKISHLNPRYKEEKLSLRNYLYSDLYKIKLENLIDKNTQQILKETLGNDWLLQLEKKYSLIEREIHDGGRWQYSHLSADTSASRKAAILSTPGRGGHMNFFIHDHSNRNIRDNIFGREKWNIAAGDPCKILCSEFVGMIMIAAIQELNDRIRQELHEKRVESIPERLIKSPISKREKLHLLTPDRLLIALQKRGAVEKIVTPDELSKFLDTGSASAKKTHDYKGKIQEIIQDNPSDTSGDDLKGTL